MVKETRKIWGVRVYVSLSRPFLAHAREYRMLRARLLRRALPERGR